MENNLNNATWNLCLGIANKKDIVTAYLKESNIKICCLQETKIPMGFPESVLNCSGYNLELENNSVKKRVGVYLQKDVNYIRRYDLEKEDHHIVIIDVKTDILIRVISLYRSFQPQGGISPETLFTAQIGVLKNSITKNCFIFGDFNLDIDMEHRPDYMYKIPLGHLTDFATQFNLKQLVHFKTWTRTINGVKKESTLDHIYTDNDTLVLEVNFEMPIFGDHNLVIAKLTVRAENSSVSICKRNWRNYSQRFLVDNIDLSRVLPIGNAQSQWNAIELSLSSTKLLACHQTR